MAAEMNRALNETDMMIEEDLLLPDDMVIEIILRFPVKTLAQLRCVCKTLNRIISSKCFSVFHMNRSIRKPCFLHKPYYDNPLELGLYSEPQQLGLYPERQTMVKLSDPPFDSELEDCSIIGTCKGVLCLCSESDRSLIYLWNPVCNKYITLPRPSYNDKTCNLGFGIKHLSGNLGDFKVVTISAHANAEVYSLQQNSWKSIPGGFPPSIDINTHPYNHPVIVKGCVHWCARVSCYQDRKCPWLIISFDFASEVFQKIMLPDNLSNADGTKLLNVANGNLCVFAAANTSYSAYEIWVMTEYGVVESWTRTCRIAKPGDYWWPLGFTRFGGIFAQGECFHGYRSLFTYQPDKMFTCSCYLLELPHNPFQMLTDFVETLVSPEPGQLIGA